MLSVLEKEAPRSFTPTREVSSEVHLTTSHTLEYLHPSSTELNDAIAYIEYIEQRQPAIDRLRQPLVDANDSLTLQHSDRVALAAYIIGQRVGLSQEELRSVTVASLLHDIGKATPQIQALVRSSERVSNMNAAHFHSIVDRHPMIGAREVMSVKEWDDTQKQAVADLVGAHHALKVHAPYGQPPPEHLLRATQVLVLGDMLDALASERNYKPCYSAEETQDILHQELVDTDPAFRAFMELGFEPTNNPMPFYFSLPHQPTYANLNGAVVPIVV